MKRSYFPRQFWALSGVLVVMAYFCNISASAQAPSIEGTYKLLSRKLPDGTTLSPPNIMGLFTYTAMTPEVRHFITEALRVP
jgi:hypothetical protein